MSEEHLAEMHEGFEQALRTMLMAAAKIRERAAQQRTDRAGAQQQQAGRTAEHAERAHATQQAALAAELAPVHRDDWWRQTRPERIARLWELSGRYAEQNDDAAAAHRHMNHQIRDRYGIDPQRVRVDNRDLTTAVAAIAADEKHAAREDTAAASDPADRDHEGPSRTQRADADDEKTSSTHRGRVGDNDPIPSEAMQRFLVDPQSRQAEQQVRLAAADAARRGAHEVAQERTETADLLQAIRVDARDPDGAGRRQRFAEQRQRLDAANVERRGAADELRGQAHDEQAAAYQDREHGVGDLADAREATHGGDAGTESAERRDAADDFTQARGHRTADADLVAAAATVDTPDAGYQRARAGDMPTLDASIRETRVTVAESFPHAAAQLSNPRHGAKQTQSSDARQPQQKRPKRSR